ncbi:MAG: hypothetical protein ACRDD8_11255 [Bacteroidales bacterium]
MKIMNESLDEFIVNPIKLNESESDQVINPKYAEHFNKLKTPKAVYNSLLKITNSYLKRRYTDDDWSGIREIINVIKSTGADVSVNVRNGGYSKSDNGAESKEYILDCIFPNSVTLNLSLVAYACGTMDNPWSTYDVSLNA